MAGTADKDYFLDADGNVTTDEEAAATLLIRKGQEMSSEVADKIGAMPDSGKVARQTDTALVEGSDVDAKATADDAKASAPSANKKASPSKNKGAKK